MQELNNKLILLQYIVILCKFNKIKQIEPNKGRGYVYMLMEKEYM